MSLPMSTSVADVEAAKEDAALGGPDGENCSKSLSSPAASAAGEEVKMDPCSSEGEEANAKIDEDGFVSPLNLPPMAKTVKKEDPSKKRSPVSMAFRPKFAVPADVYKAPKIAAFVSVQPRKPKGTFCSPKNDSLFDFTFL